ncbi:hypothetical protein HK101_004636 [Irineochytrium annulatum]|nr:hypothetical protein HK101_004636 [Irineochytrium annulatum]
MVVASGKAAVPAAVGAGRQDNVIVASGNDAGRRTSMTPPAPLAAAPLGASRGMLQEQRAPPKVSHAGDLEITDDFDDLDDDDHHHDVSSSGFAASPGPTGKPTPKGALIATSRALSLRRATFAGIPGSGEEGRGRISFGEEWRGKGFVFSTVEGLGYGLVQTKGGPYRPNLRVPGTKLELSRDRYVPDGVTENMEVFEIADLDTLRDFITANVDTFVGNDPNRHGIIQLLYSAVLSRGIETIREEDFDEFGCSLIGRHSYCTQVRLDVRSHLKQELVNLLLLGQALSNTHDGDIRLGGEPGNPPTTDFKLLKGPKRQSQFGLLSLFEHYGSIRVGEYLKSPKQPIFVVCSESHFTVLFSTEGELVTWPAGAARALWRPFDLFYYDGLAGQDGEIRLRVKPGRGRVEESALTPPLELVIGTKWEGAEVEWHGSDPLL